MSSSAAGASAISPLRTPRERHWPRPTIFNPPSWPISPTTAHTFEVPISSPTMMEEGSNMSLFAPRCFRKFGRGGRQGARLQPAGRDVVAHGKIEGSHGLAHFLSLGINFLPAPQLLLDIVHAKSDF